MTGMLMVAQYMTSGFVLNVVAYLKMKNRHIIIARIAAQEWTVSNER